MITWKFKELPITFKSTEANLSRDISKMAHANHIDPSSLITIIDGDTSHLILADAFGSHGSTSSTAQSTLSVDSEDNTPAESETDELRPMFSDVDNAHIDPELLDLLDTHSDTIEPGDWFDGQRV